MPPQPTTDITRTVLFVLIIGALLVGSLWTLLPFLSGLIWATTITIATWPVLLRMERLTGGRRSLAVAIMTLLVLLAFIVPFSLAIATVMDAAAESPALIHAFMARGLGPPPPWVSDLPWFGERLAEQWQTVSAGGPEALVALLQPYARAAAGAALAATGGVGRGLVLVLVTVIAVGILYAQGETAAAGALAFARRLGGDTAERATRLAGQAIRSVALGVVVTAVIQSILAGIALWMCGIPHAGILTAIIFVLGVAQIGPIPVLALSIAWLYWIGNTGWATVLLVVSVPVGMLDNFLRPVLIRRGVQLPMLLIIGGVIGGLISFGVVGLFIGPVFLAVTYTLTKDWVAMGHSEPAAKPVEYERMS
jgi:predicted PurR-regulated permease PerM